MSDAFPTNLKKVIWNVRPKGDRNTSLMIMIANGKTSLMIMKDNNRVFITDAPLGMFSFARNMLVAAAAQGKAVTFVRPITEYKDRERKRIGDIGIKLDDQLNAFFCISCAAGSWEFPIWAPQIDFSQCEGVPKVEAAKLTITEWGDNIVQKGRFMEVLTAVKRPPQQQQGNGSYNGGGNFGGGNSGGGYNGNSGGSSAGGGYGGGATPTEKTLDDSLPF